MIGQSTTRRICKTLRSCYLHDPGFKLEYAEAWTGTTGHRVSRQTVSRAIQSPPKRLRKNTALHLALFIEHLTDGDILASDLLGSKADWPESVRNATHSPETSIGLFRMKFPLKWDLFVP